MKITIATIGKWKSGSEKALFYDYAARVPWNMTLKELEDKKPRVNITQSKIREAELLLAACENADVKVALDEKGKMLSSVNFANTLRKWEDQGLSDIAFIIGGPDGLDASVHKACQMTIALGTFTWPHLLVRALLAEQVYRASTILKNHPYHRE